MSLKKNLKTGQATQEYFILFAIMGLVAVICFTTALNNARSSASNVYNTAYRSITDNR
jgi:hypothetical protein